jgi:hypothetical protein
VLESQDVEGGYAGYWDAYKATFLTGEKLVVAPYLSWDRYPPYSRRLRRTERVAWFFPGALAGTPPVWVSGANQLETSLQSQLASSGRPYRVLHVAGYRIYLGVGGRRPLAPPLLLDPVPLARPAVEILSAAVPERVVAGTEIVVPVAAINHSDAFWSSTGLPMQAGTLRVSAAYHWLAPDGRVRVYEGMRSPLPADVLPGGTVAMKVRVRVPATPGPSILRLTFVQEGVAWFDSTPGGASDHRVEIVAAAGQAPR